MVNIIYIKLLESVNTILIYNKLSESCIIKLCKKMFEVKINVEVGALWHIHFKIESSEFMTAIITKESEN